MSAGIFDTNDPAPGSARVIEVPERLPDPRHRLDPRAKHLWRVGSALGGAVFVVIVALAAFGVRRVIVDYDIRWAWLAVGVTLALVLLNVWLSPNLRYRYWRYEIRADEADLQYGWFTRTRQLVPMTRIQHVDTRRGPLDRRFGLASVVLYTAAGPAYIPALANEVAADVRDRIATLANVHDDL
ncbi:MAG TPA: PH domain-containing protein [Thermomicrobiales bacterium]|nr:PH domain-containing protein [Thermomicrobiales bacterium]